MRIETLLYVYLFICSGMIVFNIITAIVLKRRDRRTVRASARFRQHILQQIERINTGQQVERRHKKYLSRQLTRTGNMIAFDKMLEDLYREEPRQATEYLSQLGGVIVYLTIRYGRKDRIEAAYFPYIIKKYHLIENRTFSGVVDAMYTLLRESSIYCRENAMQALYTTGDCDCIMKALKILDGGESFFHEKLLADGPAGFYSGGYFADYPPGYLFVLGFVALVRQIFAIPYEAGMTYVLLAVVPSLCASLGQGLLAYYACKKRDEGLSLGELEQWLLDNRLHLCHWFTVDDLMYLKRGGRVSAATAIMGTMLNIKPVLHVDNEGHLINVSKARGRKASIQAMAKKVAELGAGFDNSVMFISHGDCREDAEYLAGLLKEQYGVKEIYINYVGAVIGSHSGPGTLALFFLGEHR